MKGRNILLLLYGIEILGALLCGAQSVTEDFNTSNPIYTKPTAPNTHHLRHAVDSTTEHSSLLSSELSIIPSGQSGQTSAGPKHVYTTTTSAATTITTATTTTAATTTTTIPTLYSLFSRKEYRPMLLVIGGLIIACTVLLVTTVLLAWKVCRMSRLVRTMGCNAELISNSKHGEGTTKKNQSEAGADAKETSVLMTDFKQTQEEVGDSTAKEEGPEVNGDGQKGEETKKEAEDATESEEAPAGEDKTGTLVIPVEDSPSPKQAADPESATLVEVTSAGDTEGPKDAV